MKLLFVSPFPHWPTAAHGGSAAGWAQLDRLRQRHEVALISFEEVGPYSLDQGAAVTEFFRKEGLRYTGVPLSITKWDFRRERLRAVFTGLPVDAAARRSHLMSDAIRHTLGEFQPDAVIIQFPQMAQYVDACGDVPAFMDVIDVASVSSFRSIEAGSTVKIRFQRLVNWLRWIRYERHYYPKFRIVTTLTEQDQFGLKVFAPKLDVSSVGLPVSLPYRNATPRHSNVIRFMGNFQHPPNADGLRYFLTQVLPRVQAKLPGVIFEIGGRHLPPDLASHAGPRVALMGYVPDLATFLATAGAVVIPLVSGGGVKIKTLEAMAAGAAVVSTSIGVEGIGGQDGAHYVVRDDPAAMADSILSVLAQPQLASRLAEQARALIQAEWSPELWEARFTDVIARGLAKTPAPLT